MPNSEVLKIDRLRIENYRSILSCDFTLGDVTFLVGRNGAGKTNLLDALAWFARFPNAQVGVLVVDADKDPICELRLALQPRASAARSDRRISVVIAASEFEAWIVAGLVGITQPVKAWKRFVTQRTGWRKNSNENTALRSTKYS
jgi:ABC-type cobalamin/Fe3+-siderophores transport system ATPase subunit